MKRIFVIISMFLGITAYGQAVKIDTFHLRKSKSFSNNQMEKMIFPMIRSGNPEIDSLINRDLKVRFTDGEYAKESLDSTLIEWAGDQLVFLDFEVTCNDNGILSFHITAEGCGAYCTAWTDYFNYSTTTGKWLDISEVIDITGEFPAKIHAEMRAQYAQQKKELKEMLNEREAGLKQSTYNWALKYYEDCENAFDLETYAIYPDRLKIIERCYLPNAIKNLTPVVSLQYNLTEIKEYLKI